MSVLCCTPRTVNQQAVASSASSRLSDYGEDAKEKGARSEKFEKPKKDGFTTFCPNFFFLNSDIPHCHSKKL